MKAAVFARIGSRPIPRITRMMEVTEELGAEPIYCGAMRETGLSREDDWGGWAVVRVGRPFPLLNGTRPGVYIRSVLSYNLGLFRYLRKTKPKLVHASDFETMPAAVLNRWMSKSRLIYNIHDNLAQRYNVPRFIFHVLNFLEGVNVMLSDTTLVPEDFRRSALPRWCQHKVQVIRNTPGECDYAEPDFTDTEEIRVFFGGWLDWGRGLGALLEMAAENSDIRLRVAGEGASDIVATVRQHPRTEYLGFLEHKQVLEETRRCHFISALYDPARTINRYAASNKLAEALAVGRPVIVNEEMHITGSIGPSACLLSDTYDCVAQLAPKLRALLKDRGAYTSASHDARRIYEERFAWGPVREVIKRVVGENLAA